MKQHNVYTNIDTIRRMINTSVLSTLTASRKATKRWGRDKECSRAWSHAPVIIWPVTEQLYTIHNTRHTVRRQHWHTVTVHPGLRIGYSATYLESVCSFFFRKPSIWTTISYYFWYGMLALYLSSVSEWMMIMTDINANCANVLTWSVYRTGVLRKYSRLLISFDRSAELTLKATKLWYVVP